ncbi:uncharacterized protein PHALS_14591 [Plasmopara halstedii]|uniref:Uncharacterized protein n=1 Tax=Plasmopara halstedii TaxID=4781 RepID=A0A0P1ATE5_PLAHL|nr:uncharacterized protein PHALS_14591 [Plasmopara halstedii]CEG44924.1 hypothetical protein PHALS_14591 [Plasmopara halstedii]|eukprot:XP_024581293.1 hypothetical protein PHALS_14591 [Plasmopara halstedii]
MLTIQKEVFRSSNFHFDERSTDLKQRSASLPTQYTAEYRTRQVVLRTVHQPNNYIYPLIEFFALK